MPDIGQVRAAAYRVMRLHGLAGIRRHLVVEEMLKVGARPGSNRDLGAMIEAFKREQEAIRELPLAILDKATTFANDIWEIAFATAVEMQQQEGGAEPVARRKRANPRQLSGSARRDNLQKIIEHMFRRDAKPETLIREPISAAEIYRRLTDRQAELTDDKHLPRDLVTMKSKLIYRLPDGKWWRRDRPLPHGYGEAKVMKRKRRTGGPLSDKRFDNAPLKEEAITFMINSRRPVSREEIIEALEVPAEQHRDFRDMLRNHLRGKNRRFERNVDGNYVVINKSQKRD